MEMHIQAEILEKRGEFCLAALLRDIIIDEAARLRKIESAKRKAENLTLMDEDR